jgi:phosphate transport system substrate-binding protein
LIVIMLKRLNICLAIMFLLLSSPAGLYAQPIVNGAGATFPSPLYFKWIEMYGKEDPVRIVYKETGSGEGIRLLLSREVDFGGTDAFLSEGDLRKTADTILHIPTCIGAVAIIYNLPGNPGLKLSPDILADIFLGRITSWEDHRISQINRGTQATKLKISVVHRSEGSGTTFLLSDYLTKVSPAWKKSAGAGKQIRWLTGIGVEENSGVAELVKKIPGSIGYVSLNYAVAHKLPAAALRNERGRYTKPTVESVSSAASIDLPADARSLITNSGHPNAYPISGFSYIVLFREQAYQQRSKEKAHALARFLWWGIHEGQREAAPLYYAPLPRQAVLVTEKILRSLTYAGQLLLKP